MATKCSRILNRSSISAMKSTISKPKLGVSPTSISRPSLPSRSDSSPIRRFFLSRSPVELGSVASMLPLHSAVAVARMTSCLISSFLSCRALSQGTLCCTSPDLYVSAPVLYPQARNYRLDTSYKADLNTSWHMSLLIF